MHSRNDGHSRRKFLTTAAAGVALGGVSGCAPVRTKGASAAGMSVRSQGTPGRWYERAWRRAVIDMHIPDWDEKFLSQFDPDEYVAALVQSRAQSVVCYAQSHTGLFNYPTKVGQQHRGLKGRDLVQELTDRCHARKIAVVLYASVLVDRWAYDNHPDWRSLRHNGEPRGGDGKRYGIVCPNSPYREYVRAWTQEICERYRFEGMRFDMTFWSGVCFCSHCQKRFADEVGGEIPKTLNWLDEKWTALQRRREAWLAEFAGICTSTVRRFRPETTVEHQASTYPLNWGFGAASPLVQRNDFLQGDFYGDSLQGSFVRKLLSELTPHRPFGYETSYSVDIADHTGSKPDELLEAKASAAIADHGAFIFIDAIDPIGTVNRRAHERMGRIFDKLMPYYAHIGGERVADVAIYMSLESKFDMRQNGKPIADLERKDTHTESAINAARGFIADHIPYTVITRHSLARLGQFKMLVLSNVHMLDAEETAAIREFVRNGGALYASGDSSLVNTRGQMQKDFQLADVFGVSLVKASWDDWDHYVAPTSAGAANFPRFTAKQPAFVKGYGIEVKAHFGAEVLATTTLTWPAPDGRHFSSFHSNPPWVPTDRPEIVLNRFGRGRAIYCASVVEDVEGLRETFLQLIRRLNDRWSFEAGAPPVVELTLFHQPERRRHLLTLINFQKDLPNIPVEGIHVRVRLPGGTRVRQVEQIPISRVINHEEGRGLVSFTVPRLETLAMFALQHG